MSKDFMNDEKFWEEYTKKITKMAYEEQCETEEEQ